MLLLLLFCSFSLVYLWIVLAVVDIVVVVVVVVGSEQNASVFAFKKENKIAINQISI